MKKFYKCPHCRNINTTATNDQKMWCPVCKIAVLKIRCEVSSKEDYKIQEGVKDG